MRARLFNILTCGTGNIIANDEEPNPIILGIDDGNQQNVQPPATVLKHYYHQLHRAAIQENWIDTVAVFKKCHPHVSEARKCALHFAMRTGKANRYLKFLLEEMTNDEIKSEVNGKTAISIAAAVGNVEAAKLLVKMDQNLPHQWSTVELWPINIAARYGNVDMVTYLLIDANVPEGANYEDPCRGIFRYLFLENLINSGLYGVAFEVVERYFNPREPIDSRKVSSSLTLLANQPFAFRSSSSLSHFQRLLYYCLGVKLEDRILAFQICVTIFLNKIRTLRVYTTFSSIISNSWNQDIQVYMDVPWNVIIKLGIQVWKMKHIVFHCNPIRRFLKEVEEIKLVHDQAEKLVKSLCELLKAENDNENEASAKFKEPFLLAAEHGIMEIVKPILDVFHSAIDFSKGEDNIYVLAVKNRIVDIYEEYMEEVKFIDEDANNILHLAGKLGPKNKLNSIGNPAFQLQSELKWYKRVQKLVTSRNNEDLPTIFQDEHKKLRTDGGRWMNNISRTCGAIAFLITFTAILSVTVPKLETRYDFCYRMVPEVGVNMVTTAVAIMSFFSVIAFLIFMAIFRSDYKDFNNFRHHKLPRLLNCGLGALGLSISFMIIAFEAILLLVVGNVFKIFIVLILVCIFSGGYVCFCIAPSLDWYFCNLINL